MVLLARSGGGYMYHTVAYRSLIFCQQPENGYANRHITSVNATSIVALLYSWDNKLNKVIHIYNGKPIKKPTRFVGFFANHLPKFWNLSSKKIQATGKLLILWGGRWGSNPRQQESQSWTLPTELRPPLMKIF